MNNFYFDNDFFSKDTGYLNSMPDETTRNSELFNKDPRQMQISASEQKFSGAGLQKPAVQKDP